LYDPRIFNKEREKNIPELDIGDDETEKEYFERMTRMNVGGEDSFVATARTPKFSVSSGQVILLTFSKLMIMQVNPFFLIKILATIHFPNGLQYS
jgi:hypothetical protein